MDQLKILGGVPLQGSVEVAGAKNAALPILFSSLLTEETCEYSRVPRLHDIDSTLKLLQELGVEVDSDLESSSGKVRLTSKNISSFEAPYDLVRKMRASVLVLGPLLAKFGQAKVSLPGGCAIGARPINFHLNALQRLGAEIELESGYVFARAQRLKGDRVPLEFPSVGATENLLMAATLASGETVIENAAKEPEIVDLANSLRSMGARIEGDGTEAIHIQGQASLKGARHEIVADRIEAGTFLAAGLATGGRVRVEGIEPEILESVLVKFEQTGAEVIRQARSIEVVSKGRLQATDVTTLPYPGFPTDMQAQFMAMMCVAKGTSVLTETIFENRFMHVSELARLGAQIEVDGKNAIVKGLAHLKAAPIMATDLRASASLIIAALTAEGESAISRIYHLDRGYERVDEKLRALGARVERVKA